MISREALGWFFGFLIITAGGLVVLITHKMNPKKVPWVIGGLVIWLAFVGILGYSGLLLQKKPPGPLFVIVPAMVVVLSTTRLINLERSESKIPLTLLIGAQSMRVLVELGLLGLYRLGLIPKMLTFEGSNFDILIGISAPLVALGVTKGWFSQRFLAFWNIAGIVFLVNVAGRSMLTFSGSVPTEVPNVGIAIYPFCYLPGFLLPLAFGSHLLIWRILKLRSV